MEKGAQPEFHTVRGYQLLNQQEGQLTPAMEDYLEMAYRLCSENHYIRVGKLADRLHVKPSSASKMLSKLSVMGYLQYERYEILFLTSKGNMLGRYLMERHNTIEQFLNLIGCPDPLEETELVEHALNPDTVHRLKTMLEFFQKNPSYAEKLKTYCRNESVF